jgi:hypothetical protein
LEYSVPEKSNFPLFMNSPQLEEFAWRLAEAGLTKVHVDRIQEDPTLAKACVDAMKQVLNLSQ